MRPLHVWLLGVEQWKKNKPGKVCVGVEAEAHVFTRPERGAAEPLVSRAE